MRILTRTWTGRGALAACLLSVPLVVAACGSKSTAAVVTPSPTPSTSMSVSPTAAITSAWQTFFAGTTPAASKIALLQNGQQFASVIQAQAGSPLAKATQAKVTAVKVVSPAMADVTYSIVQGGQVALPNQQGQAVLEGGVWKVSAPSFQALLKLEQGQASASPSATP
jgi:hypothetical protein